MTIRQIAASLALSVRRLARSRIMVANVVLALLPIAIACLVVLVAPHRRYHSGSPTLDIARVTAMFEVWVRTVYLQFLVFFAGSIFGFAVVRQEMDDRTLHYLFLQPVRRWVLILGKVAAFLLLSSAVCLASLWTSYLLMTVPMCGVGTVMADMFAHGRVFVLLRESLVLMLGLLAYGSIAMLMGSLFKSGFYGLLLLGWETALPYLPTTLKLWTVMHYLQSLLPERPPSENQIFALLGDPAPPWLCLAVLVAVPAFFIGLCTLFFGLRECQYGET